MFPDSVVDVPTVVNVCVDVLVTFVLLLLETMVEVLSELLDSEESELDTFITELLVEFKGALVDVVEDVEGVDMDVGVDEGTVDDVLEGVEVDDSLDVDTVVVSVDDVILFDTVVDVDDSVRGRRSVAKIIINLPKNNDTCKHRG